MLHECFMNAFVWFAVHSNQLEFFLKCIRGVLKATQMTLPAFKWSTCHCECHKLSRQRKSIKTQNCCHILKCNVNATAVYESGYLWENTKSICYGTQRLTLWSNVFVHQKGQTTHMYFCQLVNVRLLILVCSLIIEPVLSAI